MRNIPLILISTETESFSQLVAPSVHSLDSFFKRRELSHPSYCVILDDNYNTKPLRYLNKDFHGSLKIFKIQPIMVIGIQVIYYLLYFTVILLKYC